MGCGFNKFVDTVRQNLREQHLPRAEMWLLTNSFRERQNEISERFCKRTNVERARNCSFCDFPTALNLVRSENTNDLNFKSPAVQEI